MAGTVHEAAARLLQRPRLDWSRLRATAAQRCHSTLPHGEDSVDPYRFAPLHDEPPRLGSAAPLLRPAPAQTSPGALRLVRFPRAALEALPFSRRQLTKVKRPPFEAVVQALPRKPPVPWLPRTPQRETHEARHVRAAAPADSQPAAVHAVFLTPKRILGNSACQRDRGRSRVKEAVRIALLDGKGAALAGHLLVVTPAAEALTVPMPRLISEARAALETLGQALTRAKPGAQRAQARQDAGTALRTNKAAPNSPVRSSGPADETQQAQQRARAPAGQGPRKQSAKRASHASYKWQ